MEIQSTDIYNSVLTLLSHSSGESEDRVKKLLQAIVEWQKTHPPKNEYDGFEWHQVFGDPRTLNSLVTHRILRVVFKSNKSTAYRALDIKAIERALADYEGTFTQEEIQEQIPPNLFKIITGHTEKKDVLFRSLSANRPVHVLLHGVVASAKTLFLEELTRLPHNRFILGSSLTRAGIFDVLFNERPHYLIIDELEKIEDVENLSALLSLMHKGYVTETKYRRHRTVRLKTWVFASANNISRLPKELLSRFFLLKFKEYTDDEFRDVAVNVLREQEGIPENLGIYIAEKILMDVKSRDIRDCCKVARLLKGHTKQEVNRLVDILKRQA